MMTAMKPSMIRPSRIRSYGFWGMPRRLSSDVLLMSYFLS